VSPKSELNLWTTHPDLSSETSKDPSELTISLLSLNLNVKHGKSIVSFSQFPCLLQHGSGERGDFGSLVDMC
jgi:hypothetical protein